MNITCPHCRYRHPPNRSCAEAKRLAEQSRVARYSRETARAESARQAVVLGKAQAIQNYETALENVDVVLGAGIAVRIITLWEAWQKIREASQ